MLTHNYQNIRQWPIFFILFLLVLVLSACGSESESSDSGEVVIGLTDAEGDYVSYTVDVESLTLTKQDGTIVETLPVNTRVDFAQYTELTEFLTAATVPSGVYIKASMVLDYSNADIQVENQLGNIVPVTVIQDIDGNVIETLNMSVHLEDRDQLFIAAGIPAHITLDFDLKASNSVEFTDTAVIQTVSPFLLADVELERPKPHRVRGPLESVDVVAEQFKLVLRPFHHAFVHNDRRFGVFTVNTNEETVYEIDHINYVGTEGLTQLETAPQFTAVIAIGELKLIADRRVYVATEVYAGSSVPGGNLDVVKGHVVARTGDTVRLKGATLLRKDGSVIFNDEVTVELAATTTVKKQLSSGAHDISEISVGQKLTVFGEIRDGTVGSIIMDASNGLARMHLTTLRGSVVQVDSPLVLDLQSIGVRRASIFDFSGTGVNASNDADVDFYEINTGALNLASVDVDEAIKVRGFVRAFGMAPEDFDAHTLVLVADARARMLVNWVPANTAAISEITEDSITLDLTGTGRFHHVSQAGILTDLTTLASSPILRANDTGKGVFVIIKPFTVQVFVNYVEFSRTLSELISTRAVKSVKAAGKFDVDNVTMRVRGIRVVLR